VIALRFAALLERTPELALALCALVLVAVVDLAVFIGGTR
jgi:hypothetical protein